MPRTFKVASLIDSREVDGFDLQLVELKDGRFGIIINDPKGSIAGRPRGAVLEFSDLADARDVFLSGSPRQMLSHAFSAMHN